jgi:hypothetical protein
MEQDLKDRLRDPSGTTSENIEECCVLAILISDHIILRALPPTAAPQIEMSRDLKFALEQTNLSLYWNREFDLLLWVLFIGYVSSHMQAQKSWFASLFHGASLLNTNHKLNVDGLKQTLQKFLYSEQHFEKRYMELWSWLVKYSLSIGAPVYAW